LNNQSHPAAPSLFWTIKNSNEKYLIAVVIT
jgi:hypothetical protein